MKLTPNVTTDVHSAGHSIITTSAIGSTVHDSATVTGGLTQPTGTVTFTVYTNAINCTGASQAAGANIALVGGVAHPSSDAVVGVNGLSFKAHYNGNATYNEADGPCEPLEPTKIASQTATQIHAGKGADDQAGAGEITDAAQGSTVHDKAVVSGAQTTPTGTVDFTVFTTAIDCTGPSQNAGTGTALVGGIAHPSADAVVGATGLSFRAHYNGNATYNGSTGPCEPLKALPKLTVTKVVVGDTTSTFDLSVSGLKVIDDGKTGATDTRSYSPDTYSVTETLGNGDAVDSSVVGCRLQR